MTAADAPRPPYVHIQEQRDTFCLCSTGWVKHIFTTLLGRPVQVELAQAMGRGDPRCRYVVNLNNPTSGPDR